MNKNNLLAILILILPLAVSGQNSSLNLEKAIDIALENNAGLRSSLLKVEQSEQLVGTAFNLEKTELYYQFDENNIAENGLPLNVWGISQSLQFPTVYGAQKQMNKSKVQMQKQKYLLDERFLKKEVSKAYFQILYWQNVALNYQYLDSLYLQFSKAASRRFELGETNYLEKLTSTTKHKEVELLVKQIDENIINAYLELNMWMQTDTSYLIEEKRLYKLNINTIDTANHPGVEYYKKALIFVENTQKAEKQKLLPDLYLSYFQGSNNGSDPKIYQGVQAGLGIPLFYGAQKSKIRASKIEEEIIQNEADEYMTKLITQYNQLMSKLSKYNEAIIFYDENGKNLSSELLNASSLAFFNGEIDFVQYILLLESAKNIEMTYLENLFNYNKTVLDLNYLMN